VRDDHASRHLANRGFALELTGEVRTRWPNRPDAPFDAADAQSRAQQEAALQHHGSAMSTWFEGFLDGLVGAPGGARENSSSEQATE
jgi:hypothetical protein